MLASARRPGLLKRAGDRGEGCGLTGGSDVNMPRRATSDSGSRNIDIAQIPERAGGRQSTARALSGDRTYAGELMSNGTPFVNTIRSSDAFVHHSTDVVPRREHCSEC